MPPFASAEPRFQATDGRFIRSTGKSPSCPMIATLDTACERARQKRLAEERENAAEAKKAAFIKENFTDKGFVAEECKKFLLHKIRTDDKYLTPLQLMPDSFVSTFLLVICSAPQFFTTPTPLFSEQVLADLKAMQNTEYGTYHVIALAKLHQEEEPIKQALKECSRRLYEKYHDSQDGGYDEPSDVELEDYVQRIDTLPAQCSELN
ncbi:hypothetical protein H0H81_007529 [Sphagnurus paluster]|uniref:Uncharacterized protein n=1 Tax=Sphagnurus paluster TaxID=117069 RepID=A0A9P7KGQ6_9AGAR|nr:hypothetical protein H0H81_007529 [Sphagnurus paluster]